MTPVVTPSTANEAATACRAWCLAFAASPTECAFMWVYDVEHSSPTARGRCCPKSAHDLQTGGWDSDSSHTAEQGTYYQLSTAPEPSCPAGWSESGHSETAGCWFRAASHYTGWVTCGVPQCQLSEKSCTNALCSDKWPLTQLAGHAFALSGVVEVRA